MMHDRLMTDRGAGLPNLSFVIPAANENRWSDLLATMFTTDPAPFASLLGVDFDVVRREVTAPGTTGRTSDRLDLLLLQDGHEVAAIEVKLLSDLGPKQLDRYFAAFPTATEYKVLHLESLPVNLRGASPWESLTWESVLSTYADSKHAWVSTTARAWLTQLGSLVPAIRVDTVWNDVPSDAPGMELALRARVAWLSRRLDSWCSLDHDIVPSSGGGNWAVRVWAPVETPGHFITAELQEGLTAYAWRPDPDHPYSERFKGPVVLLGIRQDFVTTSADFDWLLLHRLFAEHILDGDGNHQDDFNWQTTPARPGHPTDKANWQTIVQAGAPKWLGKGWGMKVAKDTQSCLFGARFGFAPSSTLGEIEAELRRIQPLLERMAAR